MERLRFRLRKYSHLHRISSPPTSAKATPVSSLFKQIRLLPLALLKANRRVDDMELERLVRGFAGQQIRISRRHEANPGFQRSARNSRHEGSVWL